MSIRPGSDPIIVNNNFRHALRYSPGVILLEEEIQGARFNLGSRGMTPNSGILARVTQDGFPLNVDTFGTRFVASPPDLNQVTQILFFPGVAGVLFGLADWMRGIAPSDEPRLGPRCPATETGLSRCGRLSVFTSVAWLDTEIRRSPFPGADLHAYTRVNLHIRRFLTTRFLQDITQISA